MSSLLTCESNSQIVHSFLYCFLRKNLIYWACSKDYPSLLQSSPSNHHKQLPFKKRHPFPRRVLFLVSGSFFLFFGNGVTWRMTGPSPVTTLTGKGDVYFENGGDACASARWGMIPGLSTWTLTAMTA